MAVITLLPMISAAVVKGTMRGEPVHTLYYYMEGGSLVDEEMGYCNQIINFVYLAFDTGV